jgi:hypothetical protein
VRFVSENRSNAHRENPYSLKAVNRDFGAYFGNYEDGADTSIVIHSCGGQDARRLWMSFTVNNWPRENYLELVNAEIEGHLNKIELMEFIRERLPELHPDAKLLPSMTILYGATGIKMQFRIYHHLF